ncbi:MAG: Fic family protein [Planctomycetota bacterium]
MSHRFRIFVSSAQKEFAAERRALRAFIEGDALLRRFFDVFLFEDLPASGRRADQVYLAEVDRCDVYLGLLGNDYGSEGASGLSPTEREFDRATASGKERLVFVKGNDDSARHPKMRSLLRKAGDQVVRRRFGSTPELTALVYASLVEHLAAASALRTRPFDAAACPGATLKDLSRGKISDFLTRAGAERGYALGPKTPMHKALAHLNLLDGNLPNHAAVLLFGKQPQRFLVTSEVKCLHFHGGEVEKPIPSYHIYKGTVFELVDQAVDFVMSKIDRSVGTRALSNQAPVTYELPRLAVAEAIVNAVAHRDYTSNASVQVMLFADRLEVWNPGHLPPPLTPESLRAPHASIPRNPLIAEPLFLTRYIEKAGTGTLDMIKLCKAAGLPTPQFRQSGGQFIQALRRMKPMATEQVTGQVAGQVTGQVAGQVSPEIRNLLKVVKTEMPRGKIQECLHLKGRANFENRYLKPALAAGLIEMTIPTKPKSRLQKYRLTEKGRHVLAKRAGMAG